MEGTPAQLQDSKGRYRIKYTMDGEVLVRKTYENTIEEDALRTVDLGVVPSFITEAHEKTMSGFYFLIKAIKASAPDRVVPVTRKEVFENGIHKRRYHDLLKAGWLKEAIIPIFRLKDNKPVGARAVAYFTPQGRAFIRSKVDPSYAVTDNR